MSEINITGNGILDEIDAPLPDTSLVDYSHLINYNITKESRQKSRIVLNDYVASINNEVLMTNTRNGPIQIFLTDNPCQNFIVGFTDIYGSWEQNNLIIRRNGRNIMSKQEDLFCDISHSYIQLIYIDHKLGWVIV